eukprot:4705695-Amphidinium_carterae.1
MVLLGSSALSQQIWDAEIDANDKIDANDTSAKKSRSPIQIEASRKLDGLHVVDRSVRSDLSVG